MSIKIYDSVQKQKVDFVSQKENKANIYVCGATVYDDAHLGHAKSAISFDLLHRVLKANGYEVNFIKNFTDIDDKIINKMKDTNQTLEDLTQIYINSYITDMNSLNILPNSISPKATEHISDMIGMIQKLVINDSAYKTKDGIYFDTSKDSNYGVFISNRDEENSQSRVEENSEKRNSKDFALWKFKKDENEPAFEMSCGDGRPAWHIECSAMIAKYGYSDEECFIDIHGGGADLKFPHHENEMAQCRCATGKELSKYWMHNGFVNIDGQKMSKSLGNSFFLKDVLKKYHSQVVRFYLMSAHYRADFNFSEEDLISAKKRLDKLYRLKKRLYGVGAGKVDKDFKTKIMVSLNDDLNISIALSVIDSMVSSINEALDNNPKDKNAKKTFIANVQFIDEVLGFGGIDAFEYFQFGLSAEDKAKVEELIIKRAEAKKEKDFATADSIRDELTSMGIEIMDTANGTVWETK
jgi:cysteinyl-tRNA synthetase